MMRISLTKLHEEIIKGLTEPGILLRLNITETKMQSMLLDRSFITKLSNMTNRQTNTLKDIMLLCNEIISCPEKTSYIGIVEYSYKYLLNKIFKQTELLTTDFQLESYVIVFLRMMKIILPYTSTHEDTLLMYNGDEAVSYDEYIKFKNIYTDNNLYELILLSDELKKTEIEAKLKGVLHNTKKIVAAFNSSDTVVNSNYLYAALIIRCISEIAYKEYRSCSHIIKYIKQFCRTNDLKVIENIAINSSIDRLLKDYIPLEATVIIYSEYRYDSKFNISSHEKIKISDFELFLKGCGLNLKTLELIEKNIIDKTNYKEDNRLVSLLSGNDIVKYLKKLSYFYNNKAFSIIENNLKFKEIIDTVRLCSENDIIKMYLSVFDEYVAYTDDDKKNEAINLMYYLIINSSSEIKGIAAELLGKTLALISQDTDLLFENKIENIESFILFKKYVDLMINDESISKEEMNMYFGKYLETFVKSLAGDSNLYLQVIIDYIVEGNINKESELMLYISIMNLDMKYFSVEQINALINRMVNIYSNSGYELRLLILFFIYNALKNKIINSNYFDIIKSNLNLKSTAENICTGFIKLQILLIIENTDEVVAEYKNFMKKNIASISEIFLKNLKSATYWLEKIIYIDFLIASIDEADDAVLLHTATHLCNLVKVSAKEKVRKKAGEMLLEVGNKLSMDQRNEISVELLKGLEINEIKFSNYIPYYIGRFSLLLHPKELDEIINEISALCYEANVNLSILALETISVIVQYYGEYKNKFNEEAVEYDKRLIKMLGILTTGLISENENVKSYSISLMGNSLFNSKVLNDDEKKLIFNTTVKKMLNLLELSDMDTSIFTNALALSSITKFINYYNLKYGELEIKTNKKIAFFSELFNPFSAKHKDVIRQVIELGYDVYLSIDEFNWMKRAKPYTLRLGKIIKSTADNFNVFIFPDIAPVNILNPDDLQYLKDIFECDSVKIVIDIERLINGSEIDSKSAKAVLESNEFILYSEMDSSPIIKKQYEKLHLKLNSECIKITTVKNVTDNRMIESCENKQVVQRRKYTIEVLNDLSKNIVDEIGHYIFMYTDLYKNIGAELANKNISLLVIRENSGEKKLIGFSAFHHISLKDLFHEFKNVEIANYIRKNTSGKIIIIDGMYANPTTVVENIEQLLLMETLSYSLKNDFTYAIYYNTLLSYSSEKIYEELELHGFMKLDINGLCKNIYAVDMKFPICLTLDIENYIREPVISLKNVKNIITSTRKSLKKKITQLYPNNLVMSFDVEMLSSTLVEKICEINSSIKDNKLCGGYICVPYGNILRGKYFPNTITKSLHIEKYYDYSMRNFEILQSPLYSNISRQLDTIKSFGLPIIFVDDILHYGHEITGIDKILKSKNINVEKIIVAVLSSNGKDLMDMQSRQVEYTYFIPNLRLWLKESMLYPFIGGYTVKNINDYTNMLIPSLNNILPYSTPPFIEGADKKNIYDMSMLCLNNSKSIYENIELEYEKLYERKLVLNNIYQVIDSPRYPVKGRSISYDKDKKVSAYIQNDIENLIRIENIIKY